MLQAHPKKHYSKYLQILLYQCDFVDYRSLTDNSIEHWVELQRERMRRLHSGLYKTCWYEYGEIGERKSRAANLCLLI